MILGETIPNGLNPKWSMIWGWFIVVFSTTDPELVESDPALVVHDDLHGPETFYILRSGDPPPKKNHAISIGKLMINCWMMLDVAFFFHLKFEEDPIFGLVLTPHTPTSRRFSPFPRCARFGEKCYRKNPDHRWGARNPR
jgi:hypothetical protein